MMTQLRPRLLIHTSSSRTLTRAFVAAREGTATLVIARADADADRTRDAARRATVGDGVGIGPFRNVGALSY